MKYHQLHLLRILLVVLLIYSGCAAPAPAPAAPAAEEAAPAADAAAAEVADAVTGVQSKVAILVVDNFTVNDQEKSVPDSGNCLVSPDGQGLYKGMGAELDNDLGMSHGDAVRSVIDAELELLLRTSSKKVRVIDAHVTGWSTSDAAHAITEAVSSLDIPVVVNMSFAIVPCGLLQEEISNVIGEELKVYYDFLVEQYLGKIEAIPQYARLKSVLAQVAGNDDLYTLVDGSPETVFALSDVLKCWVSGDPCDYLSGYFTNFCEQTSELLLCDPDFKASLKDDNDPLFSTLASIQGVNVGAAGNMGKEGYGYPFAPAVWSSVISVGAEESGYRAYYSNGASVFMREPVAETGESMKGTSFTAARLSAYAAKYLLGDELCSSSPPLSGTRFTDYISLSQAARDDGCSRFAE